MARGAGRGARSLCSLGVMAAIGGGLVAYNAYSSRRDLALATGPEGPAQRAFLVSAAERPDIATFFKRLAPVDRASMADAVGRYDEPALAKLAGELLADFDPDARRRLTAALVRLAPKHPDAVAGQLTRKGSFQLLGITAALRPLGAAAAEPVAMMLTNADARPSAVAYLVELGEPGEAPLLAALASTDKDVRAAAADGLGKLRARAALPLLFQHLENLPREERPAILSAVAAIGDPSTEAFLARIARRRDAAPGDRAQAALGLGRVATPTAVATLVKLSEEDDLALRTVVADALALGGPASISSLRGTLRTAVAGRLAGPEADAALRAALPTPEAIAASAGRPALVQDLARVAREAAALNDAETASDALLALGTTSEGRTTLTALRTQPLLAPLANRPG